MAGRWIYVGYYRRYNRKVVYVISLITDADTGEESVIWTTYPFADAHQMNRGSVDHQQKEFFSALVSLLKEQDEAEGTCRLRKPAQK